MDPGGNSTKEEGQVIAEDAPLDANDERAGANLPEYLLRLSPEEREARYPGATWADPETGFKAEAYLNTETGEVIIGFAGTQDIKDWVSNIAQGLFGAGAAPQYRQARDLAQHVSGFIADSPEALSFAGHSLGGGLANYAARSLNVNNHRNTQTFNPAGILNVFGVVGNVLTRNMPRNTGFNNHVIFGEPLSILNAISPFHIVPGSITFYAPTITLNLLYNHTMRAF